MKKIISLLISFGLIGCASMPYYTTSETRSNYVKNHPELSQDIKTAILDKKISKGMTKEQVKASWGNPGEENQISDPNGTVDVWNYYQNNLLYFYGDKLSYWTQNK